MADQKELCGGDLPMDKTLYVNAFMLCGKKVMVTTTNKEILDCVDDIKNESNEELRHIYRSIYSNIIDFNDDAVVENIRKGDKNAKQQWQNFCDDVVLGYCVRMVLHKKLIPISLELPDFMNGKQLDVTKLCDAI